MIPGNQSPGIFFFDFRIIMKAYQTGIVAVLVFLFSGISAFGQKRIIQGINTNWHFFKGAIQGFPKQESSALRWESVSLPHTWNTTDVLDDEKGYYRGMAWYTKNLYIPANWKEKEVFLHFEGSSQVTEVYVNGQLAGVHTGGYTAFTIPLSRYLKFNGPGMQENVLQIKVDNSHNENIPPLSGDFTFFGGIYRDVYLIATNKVHIAVDDHGSEGIFISTPSVSPLSASVQVKGQISNQSSYVRNLIIRSVVKDREGLIVAEKKQKLRLDEGETSNFMMVLKDLKSPHLWAPSTPYLYQVITKVEDARSADLLDEISSPLGFRWFKFDAGQGFFLNGMPFKLIGANRHQDYKDRSNALPDAIHIRDVELLKAMGGNFMRISHYPQDPAVLQACDRLGILTSVEIPIVNRVTESEEFSNNCKTMQLEMIRQNFNHPSVIMWAYMNEVLLSLRYEKGSSEQKNYITKVARLAGELEELTRKEDPSRYTLMSNHGSFDLYHKAGLTRIPQVVGWNLYQGWYSGELADFGKFLDNHHQILPDKPLIVTEYGADADPRVHTLQAVRFDKSNQYSLSFHQAYLKAILERPFVAGSALWNLADFNSEARAEASPHLNTKGILSIGRKEKDMYLFYQANLKKDPFLQIGSQGWRLRTGIEDKSGAGYCTQPLVVFSNQKSITLKHNGKILAEKEITQGLASFDVPFTEGSNLLEAHASKEGSTLTDAAKIDFKLLPENLASQAVPFTELNVSLGDKRFLVDDELHQVWMPEKAYEPGSWGYVGGEVFVMKNNQRIRYGSDKNIMGTDYDPVYATQRLGIEQFRLDVSTGNYEVTLHFAELLSAEKREELLYNLTETASKTEPLNMRSFDVLINQLQVFSNLGSSNYLQPEKAFSSKFKVIVEGKEGIVIDFKAREGLAILNGIQVRKL